MKQQPLQCVFILIEAFNIKYNKTYSNRKKNQLKKIIKLATDLQI